MEDEDPSDWEDLFGKLKWLAEMHPNGEAFLNCVLQRFRGRLNRWPVPDLAYVINLQGDVRLIDAPNRTSVEQVYALREAVLLKDFPVLLARMGGDVAAVGRERDAVRRRRDRLARDAVVACGKGAPFGIGKAE